MRLLCLPWAGGRPEAYAPWSQWLAPDVELLAGAYPAADGRPGDLVALAEQLTCAVAPGDAPLALFGHSMGALVAFEIARALRRHGHRSPVLLGVSSERPPRHARTVRRARRRTDDELIDELRAYGGTAEELLDQPVASALVLPALRRDLELVDAYRYAPEPPLDIPIAAFAALADAAATPDQMSGWATETTAGTSVHRLPGGHFYLLAARPVVAGLLMDALDGRAAA